MKTPTVPPSIETISFRVDDPSDHHGGGQCISVSGNEVEGMRELVEQYLTALGHLVEQANSAEDGGWALTRPLLFAAHHTCELAAKATLLAHGLSAGGHDLGRLWADILGADLATTIPQSDADWCSAFATHLTDVAGKSIGARYPTPNRGHVAIDETWCCVSPTALAAATEYFAIRCLAIAQEAGGQV